MAVTSKIKEGLKNLLDKIKEPELVEQIGSLSGLCDNADADYDDLVEKHDQLKTKYAEQVKKGVFKTPQNDDSDDHTDANVSLEEIASQTLENQK